MFGSYEPFLEISLQRNFQGLLSIVQLSRFLSFFSCDSFDILSNPIRFVKNFFIFLFCLICFPFGPLQATACIGYHISKALSTVFSCPRLFRLRVSGWPDFLRLLKPRHQRQVLSYHCRMELSMFFLFFIYFRQFTQFNIVWHHQLLYNLLSVIYVS